MTTQVSMADHQQKSRRLGPIIASCGLIAWSTCASIASAQYVYNPAAADEAPGIRYFGSAKNDNGALLPSVSIMAELGNLTYILINKRLGPSGPRPTVQVDCVLHSSVPGNVR